MFLLSRVRTVLLERKKQDNNNNNNNNNNKRKERKTDSSAFVDGKDTWPREKTKEEAEEEA